MNLSKENCKSLMSGPSNRVLLGMWTTGMGDAIHALPAVRELIRSGYDVVVNCSPFLSSLWQSIGASTLNLKEPLGPVWFDANKNNYGAYFSLAQWSVWDLQHGEPIDRFDFIADILGVTLPTAFSWLPYLKPIPRNTERYTLFCSDASVWQRSMPYERAKEIYKSFPNAIWTTAGVSFITDEHYDVLFHHAPEPTLIQYGTKAEYRALREQLTAQQEGRTRFETFDELVDAVYNAEHVVAVESGVAAVAAALGKRLTLIPGSSGHLHSVGQFKRFNPEWKYEVVSGESNSCTMPCFQRAERGYFNKKCGGNSDVAVCVASVTPEQILHSISIEQE